MILSYFRTIVLYSVLILAIRLMGKRQIGEMEPAEFVVTMLVANLAAIPMQDGAIPLYSGLVPILTVLGMELVLSGLMMCSVSFRRLLCGKPVILINHGKIIQENLRKTRLSLDELTRQLRDKDVLDIRSVEFAVLETNGNVSVFPYPKDRPASAKDAGVQAARQYLPVTIIEDGYLSRENLKSAGKDDNWLSRVLKEHSTVVADTFLLTVDEADQIVYVGKEPA